MADKQTKLQVVLAMVDKATAPLAAFNKRVAAMTDPIRQVSNKMALLNEAAGFGKLSKAGGEVRKAFGEVQTAVGDLFSLATRAAAAATVAGGAIFALAKRSADASDQFDELSQKAGVNAQFFQQAAYAASFASVSQETLSAAMGKMNANIVGAVMGSKELQIWFKRAGLSMADLKRMKPEEIFTRVMAEVSKLPKEGAKAGALLRGIFGKSGAELLPMAAEFQKLTEEAREFGLVLSDDDIAAGVEFNDTFERLTKIVDGLARSIGAQLIPVLQPLIVGVMEWVRANRELITLQVAEWIQRAKDAWPAFRDGVLGAFDALTKIAGAIQGFVSMIGGWQNAIILVAGIISAQLIVALANLGVALYGVGAALMTTPIGWFIAGVTAIAAAAILVYRNWEPIKEFFVKLWDGAVAGLKEFWALAQKVFEYTPIGMLAKGIGFGVQKFQQAFGGNEEGAGDRQPIGGTFRPGEQVGAVEAAAKTGSQTTTNNAAVTVDFQNVPRGVQVTPGTQNTAPLDLNMGYAMAAP